MTGKPTLRHRNSHFRHKTAEIWDQHPSYEIKAFGKKMVLELENNKKFVPPDLHVREHPITVHLLAGIFEILKDALFLHLFTLGLFFNDKWKNLKIQIPFSLV